MNYMSCLFISLSYFLLQNSNSIRQQICDYLQSNNKIIDGLDTLTILNMESNNYINNMRLESTWGGAIEIQAACNIWKLRIIVRNYRDNNNETIEFLPITTVAERTIELYWTGGNYEPIRI